MTGDDQSGAPCWSPENDLLDRPQTGLKSRSVL